MPEPDDTLNLGICRQTEKKKKKKAREKQREREPNLMCWG